MATCILRDGVVFDGSGSAGARRDVVVRDGVVQALRPPGGPVPDGAVTLDAAGCWVTPGFIDLHTHYDAEVELLPELSESVRHGVTTVVIGSCGLSLALGDPTDLADMFCRVEGIPRRVVLPLLERVKTWETPAEYLEHLDALPLGPNVAAFLGHSAVRAKVMGLGRSLDASVRPERPELQAMVGWLDHALDAGFLGLSINTLPWDKMDGEQYRSRPTPSVFARWAEYRAFTRVLRRRQALFQAVPDVSTKLNAALFYLESLGWFRPTLKTMLITLLDARANRLAHRVVGTLTRVLNAIGGSLRYQSLPNPFDLWVDGLDVPVLEEIGAGTEALHLQDPHERAALLRDPAYRRRFRRQWRRPFGRAWHRDLYEARILACPQEALVGRTFGEVADARGADPIDTFLDLQAEHGDALRWYTVLGNDRPREVEWIAAHPAALIGFSDAGAHLRNMAHYNFPLRLLARVRRAQAEGRSFLTVGEAVRRLTVEIGDYLGIDAGYLREGGRADVVVLDPTALDERVDAIHEAPIDGFGEIRRLVRRNDEAVRAVLVNGRIAWRGAEAGEGLGRERGFGSVLRGRVPAA